MKRIIKASTTYTDRFKYQRNGQQFSIKIAYSEDPDNLQFQISPIKPYDLQEYAWAMKDKPGVVDFYRDGHRIDTLVLPEWYEDDYESTSEYVNEVIDRVCVQLNTINKEFSPRIDRT